MEFKGVELPFNVSDMLINTKGFVVLYGPWLLIVLGFLFLPVLHGFLTNLVSEGEKKANGKGRGKGTGKKRSTSTGKKRKTSTTRKPGTGRKSGSSTGKRRSSSSTTRKKRTGLTGIGQEIEIRHEKDRSGNLYRREIIYKDGKVVSDVKDRLTVIEKRPAGTSGNLYVLNGQKR